MRAHLLVAAGSFVVSLGLGAPGAQAADRGGCVASGAGPVSVTMRKTADATKADPEGIWDSADLSDMFSSLGTDIWRGAVRGCDGAVLIVSQIVNRQCSSASVCPIRIVVQRQGSTGGYEKLVDFKQACMDHRTFRVDFAGRTFLACEKPYAL